MTRRTTFVGLWLLVAACSSPAAGIQPTSPSAPSVVSPAPTPPPSPTPPASVDVISSVYMNGALTVDLLTVSGGKASAQRLSAGQSIGLRDAAHGIALGATDNGTRLATLDLQTGSVRDVGFSSPAGIGAAILSPDNTEAAVETGSALAGSFEIDIVDLGSGASRSVVRLGPRDYNGAGLVPERWLKSGILVSPGVWDYPRRSLLVLNPDTGGLSPISDAEWDALSPGGTLVAAADHINLGDDPFNGQGVWPNHLTVGPVGGTPTMVASQKDRAFGALDLADDGSLIYRVDDGPLSTAAPSSDMGLYLYAGGVSSKQFGEDRVGEWQTAATVGPGLALVAEAVSSGPAGSVEIILVSLCAAGDCQASAQAVENVTGPYPSTFFLLVRP